MRGVHLPVFISPGKVDVLILAGELPYVDVQCISCGAMGLYSEWTDGLGGPKLCPSCGQYRGERI